MKINDRIYGSFEIEEPVIIELLHSAPLRRLQRINQAGSSQYLFSWKDVTRFEHSVGVMLLLRKFKASLPEQIAGLLHDVPHTAFSHVIDFVFENEQHEFHELFHDQILKESEVYHILHKYRIPQTVTQPENFSLLEKNIPDLCADRIDYALRDYFIWKKDKQSVNAKIAGLEVHNNEFIFNNIYAAEAFSCDYLLTDRQSWSDPRESALYIVLAQAIRHALDKHILTIKNLFTDDVMVFDILQKKGDAYIQKKLAYLTPAFRIEAASREHHHLFVKTKVRFIDPNVLINGKLCRLSAISSKFKERLEAHRKIGNSGWYVFLYKE